MTAVNAPLLSFNRGEVSTLALARVDIERMRLSAETQENWLPWVIGPMMLRPGTAKIGETKNDAACMPIPFIFGKTDCAILENTDSVLRVWLVDPVTGVESLVTRVSVATAITNGNFSSLTGWLTAGTTTGASATAITYAGNPALLLEASARGSLAQAAQAVAVAGGDLNKEHALRVVVVRGPVTFRVGSVAGTDDYVLQTTLDTGIHSLAFTPTGNFIVQVESTDIRDKIVGSIQVEGAGILELPTPWTITNLPFIRVAQSGDIVFCACNGLQQRKIERRSTTSWSISLYQSNDGPFQTAPGANRQLTSSTYEGNGTLTSNLPYFKPTHVGCLFRLFVRAQTRQATIAADNVFTDSLRVSGVNNDRKFGVHTSGSWSPSVLVIQRSVEGPDRGFVDVGYIGSNGIADVDDTASYNNVICWYRVGFSSSYAGGAATVFFGINSSNNAFATAGAAAQANGDVAIVRVTGYTSPTSVGIEVLRPFPSLSATNNWLEGEWSDRSGWPDSVSFHEGRLWWTGRDRLWSSVSEDYYSFTNLQPDQVTPKGDAGSILRSFGSGPVQIVNWLLSLARLIAGREMSESSVRSSSFDEPITPVNFSVKDCSSQGTAKAQAVKVDTRGIFIQQSKRRLFELSYDVRIQDYTPNDLTRLNPDIGMAGLVSLAVQRQADTQIHCVRADGQVAILAYDPEDEVVAWWRLVTSGIVENCFVLPGDLEDKVYYVVKRTINNATKRFIERMARRDECVGGAISKCADCHVVYQGSPATVITGLSHLETAVVVAWADGKDVGPYTVSGGQITLAVAASNVVVGLPYTAKFKSAKLAYGAQMGSALNQKKIINHLGLILLNTHYQGLQYGQSFDVLDSLPLVEDENVTATDTVWPYYDKPPIEVPGSWDTDSRLCLQAAAPRPCTVSGVVVDLHTVEQV